MCSHIFEAFPAQTLLLPIVYEAFPAQPIHLLPESAGFSFFRPFLHSRYSYFAISCQLRLFLQKTFLTLHCTNSTPHHQQKLLHKHVTIQDASQQLRPPKNKLHITLFFASQLVLLLNLVTCPQNSCQNLHSSLFFSHF